MTDHSAGLLFRNAEVDGVVVDVRTRHGRVVEIGPRLTRTTEDEIEAARAGLLPGLHDHHLHLHAMAATEYSVDVGPPRIADRTAFAAALKAAAAITPPGGWVRAVGYHESVAGPLDRTDLDALGLGVPIRVQHRSGALWILDTAALDEIRGTTPLDSSDVERDGVGDPNGRLWRFDKRLRDGMSPADGHQHRAALRTVRDRLLGHGITGVTDATPDMDAGAITELANVLPVAVHLLGAPPGVELGTGFSRGPRKLLLRDHDLPDFGALCAMIDPSDRGHRREPVAVHCVSRESLILTLAAFGEVGRHPRDRIEHASVAPPEIDPLLAESGACVVTQPDFLRTRGDQYLSDVDPDDVACLYRWKGLERSGIPVVASSDAPYGSVDPWMIIDSASRRTTLNGRTIGPQERVLASTALDSLLRPLDFPDAPARRVAVGQPADLCLLDRSLTDALEPDGESPVRLTVVDGSVAWSR